MAIKITHVRLDPAIGSKRPRAEHIIKFKTEYGTEFDLEEMIYKVKTSGNYCIENQERGKDKPLATNKTMAGKEYVHTKKQDGIFDELLKLPKF